MSLWVVVTATGSGTEIPEWHSEVVDAVSRDAAIIAAGARMRITSPVLSVTVRRVPPARYDYMNPGNSSYPPKPAKPKPYRGPAVIPVKVPVID